MDGQFFSLEKDMGNNSFMDMDPESSTTLPTRFRPTDLSVLSDN